MNTLILMYVYFDKNGDIKTISPHAQAESADLYTAATFPLTEVEPFLTAKRNPFDYYIKIDNRLGIISRTITRKQSIEISYIRSIDTYLTEVTAVPKNSDAIVSIENFVKNKKLRISLNPGLQELHTSGETEERSIVETFINAPNISLCFTKKRDPYFLIHTVSFSPRALFDAGQITISYTKDLSTASVFTRKIIGEYSYHINQGTPNGI